METIISWTGNKEREADLLLSLFPLDIRNYYEPFVGSGALYLKVKACEYFINDRCRELAEFYRAVKGGRGLFFAYLESFTDAWLNIDREYYLLADRFISAYKAFRTEQTNYGDMQAEVYHYLSRIKYQNIFSIRLTDDYAFELEKRFHVVRRFIRMSKEEKTGKSYDVDIIVSKIRTALKASVFSYLQNVFNHHKAVDDLRVSLFYILIIYNASSAYLMDKHHEFNVPYMGAKGNDRRVENKIGLLRSPELRAKLNATYIGGSEYKVFLNRTKPRSEDFIYLDPPELGNYIRNGGWDYTLQDYAVLFHFLQYECGGRWLMTLRNGEKLREMIEPLPFRKVAYSKYELKLYEPDDENATHLILCNY